jgi:pimeloyl-ACP methyl ester carboxylesterase
MSNTRNRVRSLIVLRIIMAAGLPALISSGCALCPEPPWDDMRNPALDGARSIDEALGAIGEDDASSVREIPAYLLSGGFRISVDFFLPPRPRGTLLVVHGYEASAAAFAPFARVAAAAGFDVVTIDLPGHGLSDGERDEIGDLGEYGDVVADVAFECRRRLPLPLIAVGHSAGGLAAFDAAARRRGAADDPFDAMILVAPLTRTAHWRASLVGYAIARPFARSLPDGNGGTVSLAWFGRLISWRRSANGFPVSRIPCLVILGGRDDVIDGADAKRLLSAKIPDAEFEEFAWMGHHDMESPTPDARLSDAVIRYASGICGGR